MLTCISTGTGESTRYKVQAATGILRESMACTSDDKDEYVAPSEFNLHAVKEFIPQDLADFIFWRLDEKAFNKALSLSNITRDNKRSIKSIFMCHQIVSICRNMKTSPESSVGSDAGCQSKGFEFESRLGQHSFRRLTKVNATCAICLSPIDLVYVEK